MADAAHPVSSWAPLRFTVFRALWIALLVSNIGNWMQTVGAQWFLVHAANAAILVALVQVADTLPDALFGLVGGVLADLFDRRRLLLVVQIGLGLVAVALAVLSLCCEIKAAPLVAFILSPGCAAVFAQPPSPSPHSH